MKIIIFDTETTGLPKRDGELSEQPHMIQFACQVVEFDPLTRRFTEVQRYNQLIKPPVRIPGESTRITGIDDLTVASSPSMNELSDQIEELFSQAQMVVAHNLSFDLEILGYEFQRLGKNTDFIPKGHYDSMEGTRDLCKLPGRSGGYKSPKLMELYQFLFNEGFSEAHNAEKDVEALARCVKILLQQGMININMYLKNNETVTSSEQISLF